MPKEKAAGGAGGQSNREASQRQGGHRLVAGRRPCNERVWTNVRTCPPCITPKLNASLSSEGPVITECPDDAGDRWSKARPLGAPG
jgi:hypothetical protein